MQELHFRKYSGNQWQRYPKYRKTQDPRTLSL